MAAGTQSKIATICQRIGRRRRRLLFLPAVWPSGGIDSTIPLRALVSLIADAGEKDSWTSSVALATIRFDFSFGETWLQNTQLEK